MVFVQFLFSFLLIACGPYKGGFQDRGEFTAEHEGTWAVTATAFKLAGEQDVRNVKIHWEQRSDIDIYKIYRDGKLIGEARGNVFDDYNLPVGQTYRYHVEGYRDGRKLARTIAHQAETYTVDGDASIYDNSNGKTIKNGTPHPQGFKIENQYYRYQIRRSVRTREEASGAERIRGRSIYEMVSPDGLGNWQQRELAFYPNPVNFEGVATVYNKETEKIVLVAHYEDEGGYVAAKLYLAQITPGGDLEETFADRPLGFESRDQSIFIDDDNTAYILSAANMNEDIHIYRLDEAWSEPVALINTVFKGEHRETPYITKKDGRYYFFSSKASGWYPSQGMYASAMDLAGDWTPLKELGNNSTFGSQTNSVSEFGSDKKTYGMYSYRWGAQFNHPEVTGNYPRLLYLNFNGGYASMEYYSTLERHEKYGLIPVQAARNLTLGKPVTATNKADESASASVVTDGAALNSSPVFMGGDPPYSLTIDMERAANISEIHLATKLVGGSETAYKYTIEGSVDGENYSMLVDDSDNWQVGFKIHKVEKQSLCRYIRLHVHGIVNVHDEADAEWADGIYEITTFGTYE